MKNIKMYKYYWDPIIRILLRNYNKLDKEGTVMAAMCKTAIDKAMEYTKTLPDGESRVAAVQMVYIKKTHSVTGAAAELHVSKRTAFRWISSMVTRTAEELSFK